MILLGDSLVDNHYLQLLDVSSSRIGDQGLMYLVEKVESKPNLKYIRCNDNYVSEKIEKILLDQLVKNTHLLQLQLYENRLSVCCLQRIKRLITRNKKEIQDREPNRL